MSTIAVTGAAGFLGRRLVRAALAAGHAVRALAREPSRVPGGAGVNAVRWDAESADWQSELLDGVNAVWHAAAFVPADHSDLSPSTAQRCFAVNVAGTLRLLHQCEAVGVQHFVNFAAANAYAQLSARPDESAPLYPSGRASLYLTSKVAQELLVSHWSGRDRTPACSLRVSSIYGPGQTRGVFATFARALRSGSPVVLQEGGRYGADFVHVDDVAAAAAAATERRHTGVLNVASGVRTTVREIAELLAELLGADRALIQAGEDGATEGDGYPAIDISAAARALEFAPRALRDGLSDYIVWLERHDGDGGGRTRGRE